MAKIQGVHYPAELKNLAINGNFDYWQRIEGNTTSVNQTASFYGTQADMFSVQSVGSTNTKAFTVARSTSVPTLAQSGYNSTYSWLFTVTTALSSYAATDAVIPLEYRMEGLDYQKIHGKTATFGFWFNPSLSGTYSFALGNNAGTRCYVTTFAASAGWQFITLTIPLDSAANSSSWNFDTTLGLIVYVAAAGGANWSTSTLNTWQSGNLVASSSATNVMATAGATIQIAQFSIVEGPLGFSSTGFQRAGKDIQQELALCQRYFEKSYDIGTTIGTVTQGGAFSTTATTNSGAVRRVSIKYSVKKRSVPQNAVYNTNGTGAINTVSFDAASPSTSISSYQMQGTDSFAIEVNNPGTEARCYAHWTADAGL
jgi:hypothetical protein